MGTVVVKTQVQEIRLLGANRRITLTPGLNIFTGPIASGKTTLVRYLRFLLGGSLGHLPREARANVSAVAGSVDLNGTTYSVVRPAVTTSTARVEIAGGDQTWRLPSHSAPSGNTYVNWMLQKLDLPRLEVPSAPTRPESDPTPVSISDYLLYSFLTQDELGFSVFGHRDPFKNIKRKYVFEIVYGFFDVEDAQLREQLRRVHSQLRELLARQNLFGTFFADTPLGNRAQLERELREVEGQLEHTETAAIGLASGSQQDPGTAQLQADLVELDGRTREVLEADEGESRSLANLRALANQLELQASRLTRSIVSHKHLLDLEFVVCPRCGTEVTTDRAAEDLCVLCLQEPTLEFSRATLVDEQGAVEQQLKEIQDLVRAREARLADLKNQLDRVRRELSEKQTELEFLRKAYVSEQAGRISSMAARRAQLVERLKQLREYMRVFSRLDATDRVVRALTSERDRLQEALAVASSKSDEGRRRVKHLRRRFNDILEQLKPPRFGEQDFSDINRETYLPHYYGRAFAELSSPGLATLVNLAHALAHHLTAIEMHLKLPQILVVDGLSEHLGQEGLDPARLAAAYEVLIGLSEEHPELQVILVDSEIPEEAREFVRLELSEEDRLIREGNGR